MTRETASQAQQNLTKLLQQDRQTLQADTAHIDLPSPQDLEHEQHFFQALLAGAHPDPLAQELDAGLPASPVKKPLLRWRLWAGLSLTSLCLLLGWGLQTMFQQPQDTLHIKGTTPTPKATSQTLLQMGMWDPARKKLQRIADQTSVRSTQSLVFGFFLQQPGGYLYLLHQRHTKRTNHRATSLIYPLPSMKAQHFRAQKSLQLLEHQDRLLQYHMRSYQGQQRFLLLQMATPQSPKKLTACASAQAWNNATRKKHLATCLGHDYQGSDVFALDVRP